MKKKIMILGAGILQLPAIQKAKKMGLDVVAVDMNPDAVGFKESCIKKEVISTIDIPAVVECARRHNIDGVITLASDMPMRTVAAVAKALNIVGISEETALKATNKIAMRQALFDAGVPVPKFYKVSCEDEYRKAVLNFKSSYIVKPADNSGSRGIYLVRDVQNAADVKLAYSYSREYSRSGDIVVEEYMSGPEVSVETLTVDSECHVIQITDKLTAGAPHFVEMGHTQPSQLPTEIKNRIEQIAKAANHAIGIQSGPSHTEIIVTHDGPKIVELGARLGGDCITTHLVPLSTGVDMVECCIRIALGETPDLTKKADKISAIRYFQQRAGVIKSIEGISEAEKINCVKQISFVHDVGDAVTDINSSSDRLGFVILQSDSVDQMTNAVNRVFDTVKITIE